MLNAGNMHMRQGIIEPESKTLLKPFCSVDLAAAAVSSNKAAVASKCSITQLHVPLRPTFVPFIAVTSLHAVRQYRCTAVQETVWDPET